MGILAQETSPFVRHRREVSQVIAMSSSSCAPALEQSIASTTGKVVLVTGTAGFVGFHTALALKQRGDGVLGIDNFNPYYPVGLKRDRAATLEKAGVLTLEMDLNDGEQLKALMDESSSPTFWRWRPRQVC